MSTSVSFKYVVSLCQPVSLRNSSVQASVSASTQVYTRLIQVPQWLDMKITKLFNFKCLHPLRIIEDLLMICMRVLRCPFPSKTFIQLSRVWVHHVLHQICHICPVVEHALQAWATAGDSWRQLCQVGSALTALILMKWFPKGPK